MKREKTVEELLTELHYLDQQSKVQPRRLESDGKGNLLLDPLSPHDILWIEDDESYDVIANKGKIK